MYDVITIGTVTRDVFVTLPTNNVCFDAGTKTETEAPVFAVGGGAANAAVTFARAQLKTAALFRVGTDRAGDDIIKDLQNEGIECWENRDEKKATAYATILLTPNIERTIMVYRGASEDMPQNAIPFQKLKSKWAYIVPSHINIETMEKIVEHCYYQGIAIAMNPSQFYLDQRAKRLKKFLDKLKVLIVNREEAAYLTGMPREREKDIFNRLDEMVDGIAVMTDGPHGAWVSDGKCLYHTGIFKNHAVVDRTGAGDAFGAGFVAGLLMKEDIEYALRLASANATAVVEHVGGHAGALTRHEFENTSRWKHLDITTHEIHT